MIKKSRITLCGMYAQALALLAAMSFGLAAVALKKGYRHSTPLASGIIVLAVNAAALWAVSAFFVPVKLFFTSAAFFFLAGGLLGQGIARNLRYEGIDKLGASKTYTIVGASPLFAALFAIFLLGEKLTLTLFAGTVLVVGGIALLSGAWKCQKRHTALLSMLKNTPRALARRFLTNGKDGRKYLVLPFAAAVIYGFVSVIQKLGLAVMPNAMVGATTAVTAAFLGLLLFSTASGKMKKMSIGRAWPFFIAAGVLNSIAFLLNFEALRSGNVTVVMPLIGTQPLFVALFGFLFLKEVERITWKVAAGAVLVVAGAAIVTAF